MKEQGTNCRGNAAADSAGRWGGSAHRTLEDRMSEREAYWDVLAAGPGSTPSLPPLAQGDDTWQAARPVIPLCCRDEPSFFDARAARIRRRSVSALPLAGEIPPRPFLT